MYKNIIYPIYYNIAMKGNYAILKTLDYKEIVSPDYAPKIGLFWFFSLLGYTFPSAEKHQREGDKETHDILFFFLVYLPRLLQ